MVETIQTRRSAMKMLPFAHRLLAKARFIPLLFVAVLCMGQMNSLDIHNLVQHSAEMTYRDWQQAPSFDFCEMDRSPEQTRTYQVVMVSGSPYRRLVAVNGEPLSKNDNEAEARNFDAMLQQRKNETAEDHERRIAKYESERRREEALIREFAQAMTFKLTGTFRIDGYDSYAIRAVPKSGYVPKSRIATVLSGMQGRLWIDQASSHWIKIESEVVRSVMTAGFVARIEPGTRVEIEERPVAGSSDTWLLSHLMIRFRGRILLFFPASSLRDETYFHYVPSGKLLPEDCQKPLVQ
jgi:hypothetical protein